MASPYPGTTDWEVGRERRIRHGAQRRQDLWGALAAIPGLFNTAGVIRRQGDAEADDMLLSRRLAETFANPEGALPEGVSGPAYPPEMAAAAEAQAPQEGFWSRLGRSVTFGAAGERQPRLSAQGVAAIGQAARAGRADIESQRRWGDLAPLREAQVQAQQALTIDRLRPSSSGSGGDPATAARLLQQQLNQLSKEEIELTRTLQNPVLDLGRSTKDIVEAQLMGVQLPKQPPPPDAELAARRTLLEDRLRGIRAAKADAATLYRQRYAAAAGGASELGDTDTATGMTDEQELEALIDQLLSWE